MLLECISISGTFFKTCKFALFDEHIEFGAGAAKQVYSGL
jgi:hypothetical protein